MGLTRGGFWRRLSGGILMILLAVVVLLWPIIAAATASVSPAYWIGTAPRDLALEADTTYGIYVVDGANNGFSISCSVFEAAGTPLELEEGHLAFSLPEDESLMYEFKSAAGHVTVVCTATDPVYVAQVPNERAALIGVAIGVPLASVGILFLGMALTGRRRTA
ncbi:hypothetical protein ACLM5J_19340 [Nocardioides sp. Bht2]|uniref:hypothetical protein n=1 Tax=Nocardioides sp. Bht2 TaxID=3392297 RepID=UPI0039B436BC